MEDYDEIEDKERQKLEYKKHSEAFLEAVKNSNLEKVRETIKKSIDINYKD